MLSARVALFLCSVILSSSLSAAQRHETTNVLELSAVISAISQNIRRKSRLRFYFQRKWWINLSHDELYLPKCRFLGIVPTWLSFVLHLTAAHVNTLSGFA